MSRNWQQVIWYLIVLLVILSLAILVFFYPTDLGTRQRLSYQTDQSPIVNPLTGWAPWARSRKIIQPHTLVYADLTWREFEPVEGQFDFESFEKRNQLSFWRSLNKRVVFRFVMDVPAKSSHRDIPDWLYEKINGDGTAYNNKYGKGFSPNYANPVLIEAHRKVIAALGERYGKNDFFAFIELGSLGHWGEWHVNYKSGIARLPGIEIRNEYVRHYMQAFSNNHLLMRRPFTIAKELGLGIYNDMTGDPEATLAWLEWINLGGDFEQTREVNALAPVPEQWKIAPIGGEQTGSLTEEELYQTDLDTTIELLRQSHASFIGPRGPYELALDNPLQPGVDAVSETLGYRLWVSEAALPKKVLFGRGIQIKLVMENNGIAPFYQKWPIKVYILNENGVTCLQQDLEFDIRQVLPGNKRDHNFTLPTQNLLNGTYTIALAIIDPLSGKPAVQFAQLSNQPDRRLVLGSFQLQRLFVK